MSFSSKMRSELYLQGMAKPCCKTALAAGLLYDAETDGEERALLKCRDAEAAAFVYKALCSVCEKNAEISTPTRNGVKYDIAIHSRTAVDLIGKASGVFCCSECRQSFIRGIIISSASLTDPSKQYHFEISLEHSERAAALSDFFTDMFCRPILTARNTNTGLIYKNSGTIEDIISAAGAVQAYFDYVNVKIESDIRNNANRATNCETQNISRAVNASRKHIEAIELLEQSGELEHLPAELRETAELRKIFSDIPLSELAAHHLPPLTKSGINHRMKRLIEAAERLKKQ